MPCHVFFSAKICTLAGLETGILIGDSPASAISVGVISGIGRKWNRSDSSDSDTVELMTPLTTLIFDIRQVGRAPTIPIPTPTPLPVKTSLDWAVSPI